MSIPDDLDLTFSSDFSGFANGGDGGPMWQTTLPRSGRNIPGTGELEYYSDPTVGTDPFSVSDGALDITATKGSPVAGLSYTSGVITTESSFSQLYGYFQMTATLPAGTGYWPAFWLLPANLSGTDELDVMEELGSNPTQYTATLHSPAAGITSAIIPTGNLSAGPNTYGMYWTPQSISFYLNGNLVAVAPTPAGMNTPMFMIADLAVASNVSPETTFPGTMQIDSIQAYAYNPDVPGPTAPLTTNVPATLNATIDGFTPVSGVSITDTAASASEIISVTVSDKSLGTLSVTATDGTNVTIDNGWEVQFSGTLAQVNATLQTLGYKNVPTGSTPATADTLTVAATDSSGNFDSSRTSVTLSSTLPPMQFITLGSTPTRVNATGNDDFVVTAGQIADPAQNDGQVDHIINFHTAADPSAAGGSDFISLHGFAATATLVFDHYADVNGVPDDALQYYRVDTPSGNSPVFLVQMANQSASHLGNADYSFYPS
jgi:beta-glucanase (GH16 family)